MNKNTAIAVVVAVVVVAFFLGGLIYNNNNSSSAQTQTSQTVQSAQSQSTDYQSSPSATSTQTSTELASTTATTPMTTTSDGLEIKDLTIGTGPAAKAGDHVYVNYTGTLTDGTVFDSSYQRGQPIDFTLGAGQVIPGWDEGIVGMQVGGTRELVIPPALAYGSQDYGPIPANSTLIFQVQLVQIGN